MEKPLICHFFRGKASSQKISARSNSSPRTSPSGHLAGVSGVNGVRAQEDAASGTCATGSSANCLGAGTAALNSPASAQLPPFSLMGDEPVDLFPLTPSVMTQQRHSKRSGRVLNESESLQEKHGREYRFLVPWLAYAISCTIAAHEVLRQRHGIPARPSPPASPAAHLLNSPAFTESSPQRSDTLSATSVSTNANTSSSGKAALSTLQAEFYAFSTREVPAISVYDYLKRVVKYTYVSPSVLVCGCLYLDRLLCMHPFMLLNPYNVFKLFLTSIRIASKIMDTRTLNNRDFSVVGGVTNEDLNAFEFFMLELLQHRLYFSRDTFDEYCRPLRQRAAHLHVEQSACNGETTMRTSEEVNSGMLTQPTPPSHGRGSVGNIRSRRSSSVSQNEYSMSLASQSGVSPLRSVSRPAFPPSTSTAPSMSVDTESLGPVRAPGSQSGSASTSARRHPLGASCSPALSQVHQSAANGGASPALAGTGDLSGRGAGGKDMTRATGSTSNIFQNSNGASTGHPTPDSATALMAVEGKCDDRAHNISLSAPRSGATACWDSTGRPSRALAFSAGTVSSCSGRGTGDACSGSCATLTCNGVTRTNIRARAVSGKDLAPVSTILCNSDRVQALRETVQTARERIALPPVACSRSNEHSDRPPSLMGAAAQGRRLPQPPGPPWV